MRNDIKNYVVIDLDKDKILNSSPKNTFKEFLKGFREDLSQNQLEDRIKQFVNKLQQNTSSLAEVLSKQPQDVQALRDIIKKLQLDEKEFAFEMITKKNPQLTNNILKRKSNKSWQLTFGGMDWLLDV